VLYIESLEIDDHILDKIESKHSVTLNEGKPVYRTRGMLEKAEKGFIRSSVKRQPGDLSWWYWLTWEAVTVR
jgi:hypothetical protein